MNTASALVTGQAAIGTAEAVHAALRRVYDPCSVAAGAPLDLVAMGLIRSCTLDRAGRAQVVMAVTSPACFLSENMAAGIREQVGAVEGVTGVDVEIDSDFRWTPDDLSSQAKALLHERRTARLHALRLRPRQWQEAH